MTRILGIDKGKGQGQLEGNQVSSERTVQTAQTRTVTIPSSLVEMALWGKLSEDTVDIAKTIVADERVLICQGIEEFVYCQFVTQAVLLHLFGMLPDCFSYFSMVAVKARTAVV